tara:strand:- start:120 stop:290 length:171 start_codon:yes stop_codon:yes gene_type:complete
MDGKRKKIKIDIALNNAAIAKGELTIDAEPVVTVIESKIPAELADKNNEMMKNIVK